MSHAEHEAALSAELGRRHRLAMDAEIKRDNEGKFAATSGVAEKHGFMRVAKQNLPYQGKNVQHRKDNNDVTVKPSGSWDHVDHFAPGGPRWVTGKNHKDLDKHLTEYHERLKNKGKS